METMITKVPPAVLGAILSLVFTTLAFADDFKTINGKEYKDATVTRVEPDGIVVKSKSGISKLYFVELPNDVQQRFNYQPQQAAAYSAQQAAGYTAYQKQDEDVQHQREEAAAQNKPVIIVQQPEEQPNAPVQLQGQSRPWPTPRYTTVLHQLPVYVKQTPARCAVPKTPTTPNTPVHNAPAPASHPKSPKAHK